MSIKYGYVRVSTKEQNEERQIQAIKKYVPDILPENIFIDAKSGRTFDRPNYNAMKQLITNIQKAYGDSKKPPVIEVVVEELDRLGRNKQGILDELRWFSDHHIIVRILEIPTTLMDVDAQNDWVLAMVNKIIIEVYAVMAEQEMDKRVKRQREGIEIARKAGKYKGRKPIQINQAKFESVYRQWKSQEIMTKEAMQRLGLKSSTFYRKIKEYEEELLDF